MRIYVLWSLLAVGMCMNLVGWQEVSPAHDGGHTYKERVCIGTGGIENNRLTGALSLIRPAVGISTCLVPACAVGYACYKSKDLDIGGFGTLASFCVSSYVMTFFDNFSEEMSCIEEIEVDKGVDDLFPQSVHVRVYDDNGSIYLEKDASHLTKGELEQMSGAAQTYIREAVGGKKPSAIYYTCRWRPLLVSKKFDAYLFDEQSG